MTPTMIRLERVSKRFGAVRAVEEASLEIGRGEFVALLGPSGCGKTTLLRLIAGFEAPDAGAVTIGEAVVAGGAWVPPERRHVGMVFQDYALFPHLTVARNVGYGLPRKGRDARSPRRSSSSGLAEHGDRYPHELSGGQQQRRRARARARARAGRRAARRAVEQHRPGAPLVDARRAGGHPAGDRGDRPPGDARAGGGVLARRPRRAHARRLHRPDRYARGGLLRPRDPVGRRVRRRRQRPSRDARRRARRDPRRALPRAERGRAGRRGGARRPELLELAVDPAGEGRGRLPRVPRPRRLLPRAASPTGRPSARSGPPTSRSRSAPA